MTLDFHIASSRELAKKSTPDYQAEAVAHTKLFTTLALPDSARISKISDFHADTVFGHHELPALHAELIKIMSDFLDRQVFSLLFHLATIVEKATAQNMDIFVFAD